MVIHLVPCLRQFYAGFSIIPCVIFVISTRLLWLVWFRFRETQWKCTSPLLYCTGRELLLIMQFLDSDCRLPVKCRGKVHWTCQTSPPVHRRYVQSSSLNPLAPKRDQRLISPYNITPESHIKVKSKNLLTPQSDYHLIIFHFFTTDSNVKVIRTKEMTTHSRSS